MSRSYTFNLQSYIQGSCNRDDDPAADFSNYTVYSSPQNLRFGREYLSYAPNYLWRFYIALGLRFDGAAIEQQLAQKNITQILLSYTIATNEIGIQQECILGNLSEANSLAVFPTKKVVSYANAPMAYSQDVTSFGLPTYGYALGIEATDAQFAGEYFLSSTATPVLTIVTDEEQRTLSYNANGGSGAPSAQTVWGDSFSSETTVSTTTPTRTGYSFTGWNTSSDGSGTPYSAGDSITLYDNTTLYAQWSALKSTISSVGNASTGSTTTVRWTARGNFAHSLTFNFGSVSVTGISVAAGTNQYTFTIPTSWNAQMPTTTSGTATVILTTIADGTNIGTDSETFTVSVPASVVPSIGSLTATKVNSNTTVAGWNIYLQSFSQVKLTASSLTAGNGATVSSVRFTGQNMDVTNYTSGTSTNATSNVIEASGSKTYTAVVTDSRGRTASKTVNISVTQYDKPSVTSLVALRCDSDGTANPTTGTSLKATPAFTYTAVGTNTVTNTLSYKATASSSYTTAATNVTSGTQTIFAVGTALVDSAYSVQFVVTDSLGSSVTYTVTIPSVVGISFGLKNDRARFGGVTQRAGLEIDWNTYINGVLDVTPRRCYALLSSAGWYRVLTITQSGKANFSWAIDLTVTRAYASTNNEVHCIKLLGCYNSFAFTEEVSKSNAIGIDKVRYTYQTSGSATNTIGYVDVHYSLSAAHQVGVDFTVHAKGDIQNRFTANSLEAVADAPSGETVVTTYEFSANGISEVSYTAWGKQWTFRRIGKTVFVEASADGTSATAGYTQIATLPSRFIPNDTVYQAIQNRHATADYYGWMQIYPTGVFRLYISATKSSTFNAAINFCYLAAN